MFRDSDIVRITERQKRFNLYIGFRIFDFIKEKDVKIRDINYTCDFVVEADGWDKPIVVEVKGWASRDYPLRKKLFLEKYNDDYDFVEIKDYVECQKFLEVLQKKLK